jgi:hypothetical protein
LPEAVNDKSQYDRRAERQKRYERHVISLEGVAHKRDNGELRNNETAHEQ